MIFHARWKLDEISILVSGYKVLLESGHTHSVVFLSACCCSVRVEWASQVAQWSRICLTMQEMQKTWVQSLGWEDPLEEEMATHCSTLAWKSPWAEDPGGLQSMGSQRVRHSLATERTHTQSWVIVELTLRLEKPRASAIWSLRVSARDIDCDVDACCSYEVPNMRSCREAACRHTRVLQNQTMLSSCNLFYKGRHFACLWASLVAQLVKNPPAMWETWVWSLDGEDPLENGKATHSSILAWRIPWTV